MLRGLILSIILLQPLNVDAVNCVVACSRCRQSEEQSELKEVYCAMCTECKERRREWLQTYPVRRRPDDTPSVAELPDDDCPPTPICESDENIEKIQKLSHTTKSNKVKCPPPPPCKLVKYKTTKATTAAPASAACCAPFAIPMCAACPPPAAYQPPPPPPVPPIVSGQSTPPSALPLSYNQQLKSEPMYLYIGFPKMAQKPNGNVEQNVVMNE